jgi:hypothetical protein
MQLDGGAGWVKTSREQGIVQVEKCTKDLPKGCVCRLARLTEQEAGKNIVDNQHQ